MESAGYVAHVGEKRNAFMGCVRTWRGHLGNWHRSQDMQSDSGRKVSILAGDDSVGHCEKKVYMNMHLNGYRDRDVWICRPNSIRFLFLCLYEERSLKKKDGHMRWVAISDFLCYCMHRETRRSTQTNNTWSSHMSCRMHCIWWTFKHLSWSVTNSPFLCNKFVI